MLSYTEENYLKCIYKLGLEAGTDVSTNAVSAAMSTTAASVTDMLKRLSEKGLLHYVKYRGVHLTEEGVTIAKNLIRKHRLWEVFLAEKLHMRWDEIHDIAEQLEHIQSPLLVQRLDEYLGFPRFDPHGDPIPDVHGNYEERNDRQLSKLEIGEQGIIVGVREHSSEFLQFLEAHNLVLGTKVEVLSKASFDNSVVVKIGADKELSLSFQVANNLLVNPAS